MSRPPTPNGAAPVEDDRGPRTAPDGTAEPADDGSSPAEREAARRRRRARVFGEVLPEGTSDERGESWGESFGDGDDWLRRQVPPHHG